MLKILRIAKIQMFSALFLVAVFAITGNFSFFLIGRYLIIFGFTVGLEYLLWKIRGITPFLPSASFVTATIIFLLSDPNTIIVFPLIAVIFAVLQKQFIRPWNSHIFNPAGFGLFVSGFFGNTISWWGPNTSLITMLIILIFAGYVSAIRVGQWKIQIPFLLTTILIAGFNSGNLITGAETIWVGATLFFTFVMLPEPATAAQRGLTKPFYGILVGLLPLVFVSIPFIPDIQIGALLIGNGVFKIVDHFLEVKTIPEPKKISI